MESLWRQARALLMTFQPGDGLSTAALRARLNFDSSEIGNLMRLKERRGYITRVPNSKPIRWAIPTGGEKP